MSTLTKEALANWLDDLAQDQTLIAPKDVSGVLLYRPVQNSYRSGLGLCSPGHVDQRCFLPGYRTAADH